MNAQPASAGDEPAGTVHSVTCLETTLSWDGHTLTATDAVTGHAPPTAFRSTAAPTRLYHYRYDQPATRAKDAERQTCSGLAVLDADGLVLLDLPGPWHAPDVQTFAVAAGIPVVNARTRPSREVRTALAARAPGWRRLHGVRPTFLARWRRPVTIGTGVAGLAVMTYLAMIGLWPAWRGLSTLGRGLAYVLEAKWLLVGFSPALLVLRPLSARMHRRRAARGEILGLPGGLTVTTRRDRHRGPRMEIRRGGTLVADLAFRRRPRHACAFLLYGYEDRTGLFVLDSDGAPLHHLPGPWPPEDVNRFTQHHDMYLEARRLTHADYLALTRTCPEATP
ncbi:hypothetical protein MTP10_01745 [Nonomuraea sp. 3-1Str]|uniref:hypothetical protein n=1 Tax=Nonomuraea sp. 3-1Str TaxID=2929801 RepID=UPI0028558285|nr:hypothetical protein [Nonomuraea sp. 3-1Str]MDR8407458.1 hypothetical protein [Nonomuraea sp. 3-1Str]